MADPYRSNGSAAYDVRRRNTAQPLEQPERLPDAPARRKPARHVRARLGISPLTALGAAAAVLFRRGDGLFGLELLLDPLKIVRAAGGAACGKIVVLHLHVLDLGKLERAVFLRLCQGLTGDVRVDVDLEGLVVLTDDDAVADGVKVGAQRREVNVLVRLAHDIHRVEGKCDLAGVKLGEVGLLADLLRLAIGLGRFNFHAAVDGKHGLEHIQPALAACVHDARLLQDGILVHGLRQ